MSTQNPKNCLKEENFKVFLEFEHTIDAERRLLDIFEFLLEEEQPAENNSVLENAVV
ncbi:MAG: hypothetical protein NTW64_01740 [Candidatus Omnitrophica bacterium]|nr:hypothetical protein [Candidatus Omnitrophota bacterium]